MVELQKIYLHIKIIIVSLSIIEDNLYDQDTKNKSTKIEEDFILMSESDVDLALLISTHSAPLTPSWIMIGYHSVMAYDRVELRLLALFSARNFCFLSFNSWLSGVGASDSTPGDLSRRWLREQGQLTKTNRPKVASGSH